MSGHGEVVFSGTWGHEESVNDPDTVRVFRSDDQPPFGLRLDICKHRTADGWQVEAFMAADPLDGVPVTPENLRPDRPGTSTHGWNRPHATSNTPDAT